MLKKNQSIKIARNLLKMGLSVEQVATAVEQVEKINEYKYKDLDGIKFKNVVKFNITEKFQDLAHSKEDSLNYKRTVVNDNETWKIYRGKEVVAKK